MKALSLVHGCAVHLLLLCMLNSTQALLVEYSGAVSFTQWMLFSSMEPHNKTAIGLTCDSHSYETLLF